MYELARMIAGEASPAICPLEACVALAYLAGRVGLAAFTARAEPDLTALAIARWYWLWPDPTPCARFALSDQDLALPRVQALLRGHRRVARYACARGLHVNLYAPEDTPCTPKP